MTDTQGADGQAPAVVRFLRDAAADEDFFGSHARVADAVATVIDTSDDHVVIGLLGAWGSGKSTVVKLLEDRLADEKKPTLVFTYDAWMHQSDPPRRAFLERFLAFLQAKSLALDESWQEAMDLLNRRVEVTSTTTTPTLTAAGYLMLFSLPFVPFGFRLIGTHWYDVMVANHWTVPSAWVFPLGVVLTASPILIALGFYYSWRPNRVPFTSGFLTPDNWRRHRRPHQDESLLAIIANKHIERQKSRVEKTPDPTTIEFQSIFRDMLVAAAANGDRLVIVVDNLDRLPDNEAIAMWTTIRSFFLGAIPDAAKPAAGGEGKAKPVRLPTVVLPIDDGAIDRIFSGQADSAGKTFAESFMDKTFDVTFHVSRPVLSDWNAYLAKQLRHVFGAAIAERWSSEVGRIFEKRGASITPRDINRAVNAAAALWLQWAPLNIPFLTVAYYAIMRKSFEINLMIALNSPLIDLAEHDPEWQQALAAIHFGVPPESSLQILLDPKLRGAIQECDHAAFASQVKIKGFERILYSQLDVPEFPRSSLHNLCQLLDGASVGHESWSASVWAKLRRIYLRTELIVNESSFAKPIFDFLIAHCGGAEREEFLRVVGVRLGAIDAVRIDYDQVIKTFRALLLAWIQHVRSSEAKRLHVTIKDPSIYLEVADLGSNEVGPDALVRTTASGDALANVFNKKLSDGQAGHDPLAQAILVLKHGPSDGALQSLVHAVKGLLLVNATDYVPTEAAVHVLGSLRAEKDFAREALTELGSTGTLYTRTQEALNAGATTLSARLTALSILVGVGLPNPNGAAWSNFLADNGGFAEEVDGFVRQYGNKAYLHRLVELVDLSGGAQPLAAAIMARRLDAGRLGNLYVDRVAGNVTPYLGLLAEDRRAAFAAEFASYTTFWPDLKKQDLNDSAVDLFELLIGAGHGKPASRKRARRELRSWLKEVGALRWEEEIRSDRRLLTIARRLQTLESRNLALGHPALAALQNLYGEIMARTDRALIQRWFAAADLLTAEGKRTILRGLRDQIYNGSAVADLFGLLSEGGSLFLKTSELGARPDAAVRHILLPLLADADALQWMETHHVRLASWVAKADQETRRELTRQLKSDPGEGQDHIRALRAGLLGRWSG